MHYSRMNWKIISLCDLYEETEVCEDAFIHRIRVLVAVRSSLPNTMIAFSKSCAR